MEDCIKDIQAWTAPKWHPDWGDSTTVLQLLQQACIFLKMVNNKFIYNLDCYEEGYMRVEIFLYKKIWGELAVSDVDNRIIVMYTNDYKEEMYFSVHS